VNPSSVPIRMLDAKPLALFLYNLEAHATFRLKENLGIRSRTFPNIDKTTLDYYGGDLFQKGMMNPTHVSFIIADFAPITGRLDNVNGKILPNGPQNLAYITLVYSNAEPLGTRRANRQYEYEKGTKEYFFHRPIHELRIRLKSVD